MGFVAGALWITILLGSDPAEIEPNSPTSIVRPANAVVTSPSTETHEVLPSVKAPERRVPLDRTPIAVSSRRERSPESDNASVPSASRGGSITWWTTTGVGLAAVLAVLFIGSRLIRRVVPGGFIGEAAGPVHLLYRTYLTPKHSVCLVKCGDRILLVGISGERMQTLSEIHDPEEMDYLRGQLMQVRPRSASEAFRDVAMGRPVGDNAPEVAGTRGRPSTPTFADRLSQLRERITEWKSKAKAT